MGEKEHKLASDLLSGEKDLWLESQLYEIKQRAGFKPKVEAVLDNDKTSEKLTLFDVNYGLGIGLFSPLLPPKVAQQIKVSDIISNLSKTSNGPLIGEQIFVGKRGEKSDPQ